MATVRLRMKPYTHFRRCIRLTMKDTTIGILDIDCGLVPVSLFRRVAHHGESKMATQAMGKTFVGACFGKLML